MNNIKFYEGHYHVTPDGSIFSERLNRTLKLSQLKSGYLVVNLNIDGKIRTHYHHRLVASAFIENPENYPAVNHKDGNRSNNELSNLEWVTSQRNNEHGLSKHYLFIDPKGNPVAVFNLNKFTRDRGLDCGCMVRVSKGQRPHHKGWTIPT